MLIPLEAKSVLKLLQIGSISIVLGHVVSLIKAFFVGKYGLMEAFFVGKLEFSPFLQFPLTTPPDTACVYGLLFLIDPLQDFHKQ